MKRFILITGALVYLFFILICFAANAQQAAQNGPIVHIHTVKDFRGKVSVKDTSFRMDTAKMHAMMMHKRPHHPGKDSAIAGHRKMMQQHKGNGQAWAGHRGGRLKNADSISINRRITVRGDSMIRDTRRIVYFKPSPGKNYKSADTVLQYNVTVHKGMKPGAPDITNPQELNELINGGNSSDDIGTLNITDLNIYPNPSSGQFKVSFTLPDNAPVGLKITDMEGRTIWKDASDNFNGTYNNNNIDLSTQPKAVYVLEIMQNNKTMLKKLVMN